MSVILENPLETKALELAMTTQVTSVGMKTIIDKFSVYNSDTAARIVKVYKVPPGGTAGITNLLLVKSLLAGESYTCPEMVGHILMPGGTIATETDLANKINVAISGRRVGV